MNDLLNFWFPDNKFQKFWFSNKYDEFIKYNYEGLINYTKLNITYNNPDELLSIIILFDQFTRNIYRGTNRMYENDKIALDLANKFFNLNYDKNLQINKLVFALMPFRHSEDIKDQKFVFDKLNSINESNLNEDELIIYKKFINASTKSYEMILKNGNFIDRIKN